MLNDVIITDSIQRGDDFDYLKGIIENNALAAHVRINTIEKLGTFLAEHQGPSLEEAMTMNMNDLVKRGRKLEAVPLTEDEYQKKRMDEAFELFNFYENRSKENTKIQPEDGGEEEIEPEDGGEEVEAEEKVNDEYIIIWPKNRRVQDTSQYSWYRTVWCRVNFSQYFLTPQQRRDFVNAHLKCIRYLDTLEDPRDDLIDLTRLEYVSLKGYNIDYCQREVVWTNVKKTPLLVLQEAFPDCLWTVEEVIDSDYFLNTDSLYIDNDSWAPILPEKAPVETHRIYRACVYIVNQAKRFLNDDNLSSKHEVMDALWFYYVAFLDFFIYVTSNEPEESSDQVLLTPVHSTRNYYSTNLTPWEMYGSGLDVRTKHAGFLPDLFHVLNSIPLGGEQCTPVTRIGKIYQKSLPFACQRRHITNLIVESIRDDDAFWLLCKQLFWVMLADLYPLCSFPNATKENIRKGNLTMRDLMRARELTSSKDTFVSLIKQSLDSSKEGGPLVVFTAFRMHVIYMASFNTEYAKCANWSIGWDEFVDNTLEAAAIIRESDLLPEDPLARARAQLIKAVKNNDSRVARIHRRPMSVTLTERTNEVLEKIIMRDYYTKRESPERHKHQEILNFYRHILTLDCKCAISNFLLRIPPADRFTYKAFSVLTLPDYGGISPNTAELMYNLTCIYNTSSGMPKDFTRVLDQFDTRDFVISCYYFNIATELERISFVPLDAETIRRTDEAMLNKRYHLFPGQSLPPHAFNIQIALCCGRICTLMGQGKYGSKTVCFDVENQCYICARSRALHAKNRLGADLQQQQEGEEEEEYDDDDDDDNGEPDEMENIWAAQNDHIDQVDDLLLKGIDLISDAISLNGRGKKRSAEMVARKAIRTERKRFNRIPCGQPVLSINLRGRALIWGNIKEKHKQYMFCPECGAFHIYSILNYSGSPDGLYRCNECAIQSLPRWFDYKCCSYCKRNRAINENYALPICTLSDPRQGSGGEEWMYFCRNHFQIARRYHNKCMSKEALWGIIQRIENKRALYLARKY